VNGSKRTGLRKDRRQVPDELGDQTQGDHRKVGLVLSRPAGAVPPYPHADERMYDNHFKADVDRIGWLKGLAL
jgi:hypothetical protein